MLGDTTEQIAKEKLAVAHAARIVVLPDNQYADLVPKSAEIVAETRERRPKSSSGARAKPSRAWPFQGASSTAAASSGTAHTPGRHRVAA